MAYEALYRRYRPSTFSEIAGQSHVVAALRNAVAANKVGHAYLFSGPRGTGKTSSARILAKALNCTNLQGGEPCDVCESCEAFKAGTSYDLHELDAASNNGVEAMRDLISGVMLASPGRTKVYILDEVHMLSTAAENAFLKTLEEPPSNVVFVLATTEPNKVVETIHSRTQHLHFSLLSNSEVGALVDHVVADAGLNITDFDRTYVIKEGGGSARDTLSALDEVVAAGGAPETGARLEALFEAVINKDAAAALNAVEQAIQAGSDPERVVASLLADLRSVFLVKMGAETAGLSEIEELDAANRASRMRAGEVTRAVELLGDAAVGMRLAPSPRVDLEVALMRLLRPELDADVPALQQRIEALEARLATLEAAANVAIAAPVEPVKAKAGSIQEVPTPPVVSEPVASVPEVPVQPVVSEPVHRGEPANRAEPQSSAANQRPTAANTNRIAQQPSSAGRGEGLSPAEVIQAHLAEKAQETRAPQRYSAPAPAQRQQPAPPQQRPVSPSAQQQRSTPPQQSAPHAQQSPAQSTTPQAQQLPAMEELNASWSQTLQIVSRRVRALFLAGRFKAHKNNRLQLAFPNNVHRDRCESARGEVDQALAQRFGGALPLDLVVDDGGDDHPNYGEYIPDETMAAPSAQSPDDASAWHEAGVQTNQQSSQDTNPSATQASQEPAASNHPQTEQRSSTSNRPKQPAQMPTQPQRVSQQAQPQGEYRLAESATPPAAMAEDKVPFPQHGSAAEKIMSVFPGSECLEHPDS